MKKLMVFALLSTLLSINNITNAQTVEEVTSYTCVNHSGVIQDVTIHVHSFRKTANGTDEIRFLNPPVVAEFRSYPFFPRSVSGTFSISQWDYRYVRFQVKVGGYSVLSDFADRHYSKKIRVQISITEDGSPRVIFGY